MADVVEPGGELSLGSGASPSGFDDTRDRRFFTLADLERLCLYK